MMMQKALQRGVQDYAIVFGPTWGLACRVCLLAASGSRQDLGDWIDKQEHCQRPQAKTT